MPRQVQSLALKEFTGGLNLRADQFQLAQNESPDILNMDVDPRGGVALRAGVTTWNDPVGGSDPIHSLAAFYGADDTHQLIVGAGVEVLQSQSGGEWETIKDDQSDDSVFDSAQMLDAIYIQNGVDAPIEWDGSTATRMGDSWANDFAVPGSGNMPIAKCITAHNGHMFVANTVEADGAHPNRVRFSHIGKADAFRQNDYFDVDPGVDGDEIVALVPFTDHLVVFKEKSCYLVYGFDADSFQLQPLSREVGACSRNATVGTPQGVYFFSYNAGLMLYDGRGLVWKYERLVPTIERGGDIPLNQLETVSVAWIKNRVWASVPWGIDGDRRVFVLDPSLGKLGAWTMYDLPLGLMIEVGTQGTSMLQLGASGTQLLQLEQEGQPYDEFGDQQGVEFGQDYIVQTWPGSGTLGDYTAPSPDTWFEPFPVSSGTAATTWTDGQWNPNSDTFGGQAYKDANGSDVPLSAMGGWKIRQRVFLKGYGDTPFSGGGSLGLRFGSGLQYIDPPTDSQPIPTAETESSGVQVSYNVSNSGWDVYLWHGSDYLLLTENSLSPAGVGAYLEGSYLDLVLDPEGCEMTLTLTAPSGLVLGTMTWTDTLTAVRWVHIYVGVDSSIQPGRYTLAGYGTANAPTHIESHYTTPWLDAGEVAIRKRWRRPWFVFLGQTNDVVEVAVYHNYDASKRKKTFYEQVSRTGDGPRWDSFYWDDSSVWGGEGRSHSIERGSTLGLSYSAQLRLRGPESNAAWGLDNITFTYIPRKLR